MANKKPRFPVREYLGSFEAWILVMKGRSAFRSYDSCLEQFFAAFPNKTGVEQFTSVDIADWKALKIKQGIAELTLHYYLGMIGNFWKWLIEDKELPINNPIRAYKRAVKGKYMLPRPRISLEELERFLACCPSNKERELVLRVVQGANCRGYSRLVWCKRAADKAGLKGFSLLQLKSALGNRLSREIVQAYCQKLRDAFPAESKPEGDTLTTVESATLNVWASVSDYRNNTPPIGRVDEEQSRSEG